MSSRFYPTRLIARARHWLKDENGSYTLEAVIWMPIFAILLAIIVNVSMVFYYEAQMLRVTQDATRAYSLGRFPNDPDNGIFATVEAENYILNQLAYLGADIDVDVSEVGFVASSVVVTNAAELMPFDLFSGPFQGVPIGVSTQFIIEF